MFMEIYIEPVHLGDRDVSVHWEPRWEADRVEEDTVRGPALVFPLKFLKNDRGEYDHKVWQNTELVDVDGLKVMLVFVEELDNDNDVENNEDSTDKRVGQKLQVFIWDRLASYKWCIIHLT